MSDLELRSQLYGFLGGATAHPDGDVWDHARLRTLVDGVMELPAMRDRVTAAPTGPDPRTDAAEVKTAPCGCRYVGNAGLRDIVMLEKCERHRRPRTDAAVER